MVDDDGRLVPPGETGEVCVAPAPGDDRYRLMLGYWRRPDDTAKALAGGALHTGDVGFVDDDGYLHLRDRKSLVIIRGGPTSTRPRWSGLLRSSTASPAGGRRRPGRAARRAGGRGRGGSGRRAGLDLDAVREHCARHLAKYKVPERFVVVDALPRNAMGKVARTELPALLAPPIHRGWILAPGTRW